MELRHLTHSNTVSRISYEASVQREELKRGEYVIHYTCDAEPTCKVDPRKRRIKSQVYKKDGTPYGGPTGIRGDGIAHEDPHDPERHYHTACKPA